jgi:ATP-binding protein involved in chromosome partitioning
MTEEKCDEKSECSTCAQAGTCSQEQREAHEKEIIARNLAQVRRKFMVLSGKGGVGKSTVSVNLAATLSMLGKATGILDADIHGPNIPKMLGVELDKPEQGEHGLLPVKTIDNLKVMSIGFFLHTEDDAIIWRGPLKHNLLKQFFGEVEWGALDYLVMDLPPGTGDEALSIYHLIKQVDGAIIVTTPQDVALLDSRKSINFCRELGIPVIGLVENMSGMLCPHCKQEIDLFKTGGGERAAKEMKVPFLGRIPLEPEIVICTDNGRPYVNCYPDSEIAVIYKRIAETWMELLESGKK